MLSRLWANLDEEVSARAGTLLPSRPLFGCLPVELRVSTHCMTHMMIMSREPAWNRFLRSLAACVRRLQRKRDLGAGGSRFSCPAPFSSHEYFVVEIYSVCDSRARRPRWRRPRPSSRSQRDLVIPRVAGILWKPSRMNLT